MAAARSVGRLSGPAIVPYLTRRLLESGLVSPADHGTTTQQRRGPQPVVPVGVPTTTAWPGLCRGESARGRVAVLSQERPILRSKSALEVELRGFEPLTPSMRTRCATGLRYSPNGTGVSVANLAARSRRRRVPRGGCAGWAGPSIAAGPHLGVGVLIVELVADPARDVDDLRAGYPGLRAGHPGLRAGHSSLGAVG